MQLSPTALRVLGALVEKAMATPQQYPLSLNALRAATNQTTGRDPVVSYDEATVREGIAELVRNDLVITQYANRSNTPKYAHTLDDHLEIGPAETALLGVLLLRGPQTGGELRQRTDRLHTFAELADVHEALRSLQDHPFTPLVQELPRQPGQKETRWTHLLGAEPTGAPPGGAPAPQVAVGGPLVAAGVEGGVAGDDGAPHPAARQGGAAPVQGGPAGRPVTAGPAVEGIAEELAELRDDLETLQVEVERLRRLVEG